MKLKWMTTFVALTLLAGCQGGSATAKKSALISLPPEVWEAAAQADVTAKTVSANPAQTKNAVQLPIKQERTPPL